jgi:hypothetical protein
MLYCVQGKSLKLIHLEQISLATTVSMAVLLVT